MKGLGRSYTSDFYGIVDLDEAKAFLQDPYLGKHLQKISEALLNLDNDNATQIMGRPDDMKLKSSMTLFACADPENAVFEKVLEKFYNGHKDGRTLKNAFERKMGNTKNAVDELKWSKRLRNGFILYRKYRNKNQPHEY